jgi:Putative esterase
MTNRNFPVTQFLAAARSLLIAAALSAGVLLAQTPAAPTQHLFFHISLGSEIPHPVSGRLLLFAAPDSGNAATVDVDMMSPNSVYIAAKEVPNIEPGKGIDIDADDIAFPKPLSQANPGTYRIQAVLDVHHSYNYSGRGPGDLLSATTTLTLPLDPTQTPSITLAQVIPDPPDPLAQRTDLLPFLKSIDHVSPVLSAFWGREIHMRGWVLLPPGYNDHPKTRYPTVYFTHGFGGTLPALRARYAPVLFDRMKNKHMPEMIWVLLDESSPTGTHEFADSVNNGPWGTALTTDLIPTLESTYRMDARVSGRFLQGHSSGGWATLWLQTQYPKIFGGTWSTSPDPSDFHAFSTVDLYAPSANMYRAPDGAQNPIMRVQGQPRATMQQLSGLESVLGDYGGQLASFEWVFSPRGPDGRPMQIFNRATGDIDPAVAAYWHSHYDIVKYLNDNWNIAGRDLRGKIHLFVGTEDTFYLDRAAHNLQSTLDRLGAKAEFTFLPGRTHFDLYVEGQDRWALFDRIAAEMYRVARPGAK